MFIQLCFLCNISLFLSWDICFFPYSLSLWNLCWNFLDTPFLVSQNIDKLFEGSSLSKRCLFFF